MSDKEKELEAAERAAASQVEEAGKKAAEEAKNKGLNEEEINRRIEAARKEEKDKLYPQIEALRDSIKEVQEILRQEREEKERIKVEAEEKAKAEREESMTEAEKQLAAIKKIEEQLTEERQARLKMEEEREKDKRLAEIERYRQEVLQNAGDEIIPELVQGESVEEIDRAVHIAKSRFEELNERFKASYGKQFRKNMPGPTHPDTEALEQEELDSSLSQVDQDKYLQDPAYRDKIKAELANAYAKQMGR